MQSRRVLEAVSGITNPFSSSFEDNTYKELIGADDIGRKAVADLIDSLLVKKSVFHNP